MAIPDYQTIMLHLLKFAGDNQEHSLRETIDFLAAEFSLSDEERKELLPSGSQATFDNRVGWARTYMKKAGLLESTRRGYFCITVRGKKVLAQNPQKINVKFLKQFPEFVEFQKPKKRGEIDPPPVDITPEESLEAAYQELQDGLA
ncbi:MAG: restriction endonuclease, partial [Desulfobacterales bacterium]|nr:restriction endonuclease [Desulfobacterales bacterium]